MSANPGAVRVDVFSDYTCPWCYVGWARLERALGSLPDGVEVAVRWRPLEIHPDVPPEGMPVEELPYAPDRWRTMQEALLLAAAEEGLDVGKRPKVSNTHLALASGAYAQAEEPERFAKFHETLFKGYFTEGRDLGERSVIDDLAALSGLDAARLSEALDTGRYEPELEAAAAEARAAGIRGTPTFVFGGSYAVAGAHPAEQLRRMIDAAYQDLSEGST